MFFALCASAIASLQMGLNPLGIPEKFLRAYPIGNVVVATVNGSPIKAVDVESLLWDWRGDEATQELVSAMLVAQDAKKQGVSVSDKEVEEALAAQLKAMTGSLQPGQTLEEALKADGFSPSRLFLRKRAELLVNRILAKNFDASRFVKVSTMIFKPKDESGASISEAIGNAQKAYDALAAGKTWDAVMAANTNDANILKGKGLLGWRDISVFPTPTQEQLRSVALGGITKPVQTVNGIQIFRLEALGKDASAKDLEELKAIYMQTARTEYVNRIRSTAKIEKLWPPK